jgi:hypothetical protein
LSLGTGFAAPNKIVLFHKTSMRANGLSRHKFMLLIIAFSCAMLAPSHNTEAFSLGFGDSHELGFLWPGIQRKSDRQNTTIYVNHLIVMALGGIDIGNGQVYFRSNNAFNSLPTATRLLSGTGRTINLRGGGLYTYLFATYARYGSEVWYIGDLRGILTIPFVGGRGYLTGWTLVGVGVPDGGITVMLLGVALGVLALARRFLMR